MSYKISVAIVTATLLIVALSCSSSQKSPDVKADVEKALSQANLGDVKVSQDRDKGVLTLSGDVSTDADKQRAENVARSAVGSTSFVIANQIGIRPSGFESESKHIDSSLDSGIEKNFEAALTAKQLNQGVKYSSKNGVLTLTGEVDSVKKRHELEQLAASVPNVKQVVNELQIKKMKASSRK
jgi:hyperosmotically inducible periplasmic protein